MGNINHKINHDNYSNFENKKENKYFLKNNSKRILVEKYNKTKVIDDLVQTYCEQL